MRCEHKTCKFRFNCELQKSKSKYKLIINNPKITECIYHQPLKVISKSA